MSRPIRRAPTYAVAATFLGMGGAGRLSTYKWASAAWIANKWGRGKIYIYPSTHGQLIVLLMPRKTIAWPRLTFADVDNIKPHEAW